ncbi:hypothetical protein [Salmonella phage SD-1_S14]|nr:hypothetical protein [Salmonella phage SD-1_S14]
MLSGDLELDAVVFGALTSFISPRAFLPRSRLSFGRTDLSSRSSSGAWSVFLANLTGSAPATGDLASGATGDLE